MYFIFLPHPRSIQIWASQLVLDRIVAILLDLQDLLQELALNLPMNLTLLERRAEKKQKLSIDFEGLDEALRTQPDLELPENATIKTKLNNKEIQSFSVPDCQVRSRGQEP